MIMETTLTTPRGSRVRSRSQRQYILIAETVNVGKGEVVSASIVRRSDNQPAISAYAAYLAGKEAFHGPDGRAPGPLYTYYLVMHAATGEVVR
jgi:hypothetical protein